MSFRQFLSEWHVQVAQSAGQRMIEKVLADRGVELKVAVRLPSFLGVSLILVNTDLVVTVPDLLGRSLATSPLRHVKAVPAPFAVPTYTCQPTPCASTGTSATITTCRVNGCGKLWPTCSWNQTSHPGMACNLKYREKNRETLSSEERSWCHLYQNRVLAPREGLCLLHPTGNNDHVISQEIVDSSSPAGGVIRSTMKHLVHRNIEKVSRWQS